MAIPENKVFLKGKNLTIVYQRFQGLTCSNPKIQHLHISPESETG